MVLAVYLPRYLINWTGNFTSSCANGLHIWVICSVYLNIVIGLVFYWVNLYFRLVYFGKSIIFYVFMCGIEFENTIRITYQFSLTKLMVSHDLLCLTVTNQITFDQLDSNSVSNFERAMDRCCQVLVSYFFLVSKLETLDTISFN